MTESDLARRVRERLGDQVEWDPERRALLWTKRQSRSRKSKPSLDALDLPRQRAPDPVGAVGRLVPTPHEMAILRRAALGFIMVTQLEGKTVFVFEDGSLVCSARGRQEPLSEREFARLQKFLIPDRDDALFPDCPPQRWNARRLP